MQRRSKMRKDSFHVCFDLLARVNDVIFFIFPSEKNPRNLQDEFDINNYIIFPLSSTQGLEIQRIGRA